MASLNIRNILSSIIKEAELIVNQSQNILLKGGDGLQGNNFFAGNMVEVFIADILRRALPDRFEVVTGYILDHSNFNDNTNLQQVDCIIIDKAFSVFHRFKDLNISVVSKESVCGILEIKRNLRNQLTGSIDHIGDIVAQANLTKDDDTPTLPYVTLSQAPGNAVQSPYRSNPLIGIIALESGYDDRAAFNTVVNEIEGRNSLIDFIWCMDGGSYMTQKNGNIFPDNRRTANASWRSISGQHQWNVNFKDTDIPEKILMRIYGFIIGYLNRATGKNVDDHYVNNYYFNRNIFENPAN